MSHRHNTRQHGGPGCGDSHARSDPRLTEAENVPVTDPDELGDDRIAAGADVGYHST